MDFAISEMMMFLLFIILPLAVLVFLIIFIRNWMLKQTKLKEEQNSLLRKIANK
jgi:hypothetical protein